MIMFSLFSSFSSLSFSLFSLPLLLTLPAALSFHETCPIVEAALPTLSMTHTAFVSFD